MRDDKRADYRVTALLTHKLLTLMHKKVIEQNPEAPRCFRQGLCVNNPDRLVLRGGPEQSITRNPESMHRHRAPPLD